MHEYLLVFHKSGGSTLSRSLHEDLGIDEVGINQFLWADGQRLNCDYTTHGPIIITL